MEIPTTIIDLIETWTNVPAFVRDEHLTVVAANPLARALSESFMPGINLAKFAFTDPTPEATAVDWTEMSGQVIAALRDEAQRHSEDGETRRIIGELASKNSHFADVWAADRRAIPQSAALDFEHPRVGLLRMWYQYLSISENSRLVLVIWHPANASSAEALARLAEIDGIHG